MYGIIGMGRFDIKILESSDSTVIIKLTAT